jgi:hypothetical protein
MALDPLTAGLDLANNVISKLWPDKSDQERQEIAAALVVVQGQIDINKVEAGSNSLFVAGWRPAVGWVCALSFGFKYIGGPLLILAAEFSGHKVTLPVFDYAEMMPILFGMLGLGGFRTFEKVKGTK